MIFVLDGERIRIKEAQIYTVRIRIMNTVLLFNFFLKGCGLENLQEFFEAAEAAELPWDQLPQLVHPQAGQLPPDRYIIVSIFDQDPH